MPELPDVEGFRRKFAEHAEGREVRAVRGVDQTMVRGTTPRALQRALKGKRFREPRRRGKLLICPTDGPTLLLHFGMTGTLVPSGPNGARHPHDRLTLEFADGQLAYRNMRKFGGVWLAPDERELESIVGRLGPDWLDISRRDFERIFAARRASLKAALMNQAHAAGLGNLTADEALWRARLDPRRPFASLGARELDRLYRSIRRVLAESIPYGLVPAKRTWLTGARDQRDGHCPRCAARLVRTTIGGRTTVFCPREQV